MTNELRTVVSGRGFTFVKKPDVEDAKQMVRVISESSAIGPYPDSLENPGSSYLWLGPEGVQINREEAQELVYMILHWLYNKRLPLKDPSDGKQPPSIP